MVFNRIILFMIKAGIEMKLFIWSNVVFFLLITSFSHAFSDSAEDQNSDVESEDILELVDKEGRWLYDPKVRKEIGRTLIEIGKQVTDQWEQAAASEFERLGAQYKNEDEIRLKLSDVRQDMIDQMVLNNEKLEELSPGIAKFIVEVGRDFRDTRNLRYEEFALKASGTGPKTFLGNCLGFVCIPLFTLGSAIFGHPLLFEGDSNLLIDVGVFGGVGFVLGTISAVFVAKTTDYAVHRIKSGFQKVHTGVPDTDQFIIQPGDMCQNIFRTF